MNKSFSYRDTGFLSKIIADTQDHLNSIQIQSPANSRIHSSSNASLRQSNVFDRLTNQTTCSWAQGPVVEKYLSKKDSNALFDRLTTPKPLKKINEMESPRLTSHQTNSLVTRLYKVKGRPEPGQMPIEISEEDNISLTSPSPVQNKKSEYLKKFKPSVHLPQDLKAFIESCKQAELEEPEPDKLTATCTEQPTKPESMVSEEEKERPISGLSEINDRIKSPVRFKESPKIMSFLAITKEKKVIPYAYPYKKIAEVPPIHQSPNLGKRAVPTRDAAKARNRKVPLSNFNTPPPPSLLMQKPKIPSNSSSRLDRLNTSESRERRLGPSAFETYQTIITHKKS